MTNSVTLSENAQKVLTELNSKGVDVYFFGSDIAAATFIAPRSVTGTINALVKKGLVSSRASEDETVAQKLYALTPSGAEVIQNDFVYVKPE